MTLHFCQKPFLWHESSRRSHSHRASPAPLAPSISCASCTERLLCFSDWAPPAPLGPFASSSFSCHSCSPFAFHRPRFFKTADFRFLMFFFNVKEGRGLCEIWNISSKYIKAQCLINVFKYEGGHAPQVFSVSGHAVNTCMFLLYFLWSSAFCTETE